MKIKKFVIGLAIVIYIIFTISAFKSLFLISYTGTGNVPNDGIATTFLSDIPIYQEFTAVQLDGVRLFLKNENNVSEGIVIANIYEKSSNELCSHFEIPVSDIQGVSKNDYIDCIADSVFFIDKTTYYLELSTRNCPDNSIKTYIGSTLSVTSMNYDNGNDYSGKMLYFCTLTNNIPFNFIIWISITCICFYFVLQYIFGQELICDNKKNGMHITLSPWIVAFVIAGLVVNGSIDENILYTGPREISIGIQGGGVQMSTWASYYTELEVEGDDLQSINFVLREYPENLGTFVIVISSYDSEDICYSVESNTMEVTEGQWYSWDVSDIELEVGQKYKFAIYTGKIESYQEMPYITDIVVSYGTKRLSYLRIAGGIGVAFAAIAMYHLKKVMANNKTNRKDNR